MELLEPHLSDTHSLSISEVCRSIHVALLCVQQRPEDRPSMSSVILMLNNEGVLPPAKQPGFFTEGDSTSCSSRNELRSTNEITITSLEPRQKAPITDNENDRNTENFAPSEFRLFTRNEGWEEPGYREMDHSFIQCYTWFLFGTCQTYKFCHFCVDPLGNTASTKV